MDEKFHELLLPQEIMPETKTFQAVINGKESDFDLNAYNGNYIAIIFLSGSSHSISEHTLSKFSDMAADFENVGCKLLAVTKASTFTIEMWLNALKETVSVIPIIADQKAELIRPFGVLHNDNRLGHPANSVFIVDGNSKVRYLSILEPTVEHEPVEILDLVQQFQSTDDGNHVVMSGGQLVENSLPAMKKYFETSALAGSVQPSARKQLASMPTKKK
jgi:alkyl hydroperoxide reductase subunit AhpC